MQRESDRGAHEGKLLRLGKRQLTCGLWLTAGALSALCVASPAAAQMAQSQPQTSAPSPSWSFTITPYAWLPTLFATLNHPTPGGGTAQTTTSAGIGDYISDINFALMLAGQARYDRFSLLTDLIYMNASLTSSSTHLVSVDPGTGKILIPRSQETSIGSRLATTVWTLAGGYAAASGDWGNVDVIAGMRLLAIGDTTNYGLATDIQAPDGSIALARNGSLSIGRAYVEGIGGVTGRINIPNSSFYVPFYFDVGGGGVPLTWQAFAGVGYRAASWVDLSVGYRYLAFENGGRSAVQRLAMGGAILTASFHF